MLEASALGRETFSLGQIVEPLLVNHRNNGFPSSERANSFRAIRSWALMADDAKTNGSFISFPCGTARA